MRVTRVLRSHLGDIDLLHGLLGVIHTDDAGPLSVISNNGAKYFVPFIDDESRWLTMYPLNQNLIAFTSFSFS